MKDLTNYKTLRKAVTEAWEAIGKIQLDDLIDSMHARCQAVIDVDGKATKYQEFNYIFYRAALEMQGSFF